MSNLGGYGTSRVVTPGAKNILAVPGSFETDGTNAPINVRGQGFTVAKHANTGQWVVTLDRAVKEIINVEVWVDGTTGTNDAAYNIVASNTNGSIRAPATVRLEGQSAAGAAANLDGPRINFVIWCNTVTQ